MLTWKTLLVGLAALAAGGWLLAGWAALERARQLCAQHCAEAGLQFLDQSIALIGSGPVRRDGRWYWRRRYRFEVSRDGLERQSAQLSMLGWRLEWLRLPEPMTPPSPWL